MSPNKPDNKDENYQFNDNQLNDNQFIYQFQDQSDDDEHILNNGYTLLNQDQNQDQLNDDSSEYSSDSDNEQINNDSSQINNDKNNLDESIEESRFKSYLNNNHQLDEINFQREWDKKEDNQLNKIDLDEDNINKIKECMKNFSLPSQPDWANKISESNLTNFIYQRLASDKD